MGRPKGEDTEVQRLPLRECRMIRFIAKKLGIDFKTAFRRIASSRIEDIHRRIKSGEHVELGESGA